MQPDDERQRRAEVERGIQAKAILESPLWDEAYSAIVNQELSRLLTAATPDEAVLEHRRRILALHEIKSAFARIMQTGKLAEQQLAEARDVDTRT